MYGHARQGCIQIAPTNFEALMNDKGIIQNTELKAGNVHLADLRYPVEAIFEAYANYRVEMGGGGKATGSNYG